MKNIIRLALQFPVSAVDMTGFSLWDLEKFHQHTLGSVGLTGFTNELGDQDNYQNNLSPTLPITAEAYYLRNHHELPLKDVLGLDPSNFFQNIYQVCRLLQDHWKRLNVYRRLEVNEYRTHILFPVLNSQNEKCLCSISVWYEKTTFSLGLNFDEAEDKISSVTDYYGHSSQNMLFVLPGDSKAQFLSDPDAVENGEDYKLLSFGEFRERVLAISETTIDPEPDAMFNKRKEMIQERIRVELAYLDECYTSSSVTFTHPDGEFTLDFADKEAVVAV